jgi:hypothetical protein
MAEMQDVEAAVGGDKFFARSAKRCAPFRQFVPRDDFAVEIHGAILPTPCRLATIYRSGSSNSWKISIDKPPVKEKLKLPDLNR